MEKYYRIETMDIEKKVTTGGYMCALMLLMCEALGVPADSEDDVIAESARKSKDPVVKQLLLIMLMICDIPKPEAYKADTQNNYCLYSREEFHEAHTELQELDALLADRYGSLKIIFKCFELEDEDMIYADNYQVVIPKDVYERKNKAAKYHFLDECYENDEGEFVIEGEEAL